MGARSLSFLIRGEAGEYHLTAEGEPQPDDSFLVILSAHTDAIEWTLPSLAAGRQWTLAIDTDRDDPLGGADAFKDGSVYPVQPRSLVVLARANEG